MAVSTTTAPELTAEQVQKLLVQPLEDRSVILGSGVQIFNTNGSPVRVPKMGGATAPGWVPENGLISEVSPTFDEVVLLPETIGSVKTLTLYSNELARQSIVGLDTALQSRLVKDVADVVDHAFISGDGDEISATAGTSPVGILNMAGTQPMTAVGALSLDDLHDAEGLALGADVDPTRLRWLMRSETFVALRKIKDLQDRYQIQPDPTEAGAYTLLGHRVTVTNRIPVDTAPTPDTTSVVLWDPSQVAVARDLSPSVTFLRERYAEYDQQAIRVVARYDIGALNAEAVVVLRGVNV